MYLSLSVNHWFMKNMGSQEMELLNSMSTQGRTPISRWRVLGSYMNELERRGMLQLIDAAL